MQGFSLYLQLAHRTGGETQRIFLVFWLDFLFGRLVPLAQEHRTQGCCCSGQRFTRTFCQWTEISRNAQRSRERFTICRRFGYS